MENEKLLPAEIPQTEKSVVIYRSNDGTIQLEVFMCNGTVWMNRQQMSALFDRDVKTIGKHINNALKEELKNFATVAKFATLQKEGERLVNREMDYYSLDMVLSVGYRVKSQRGIDYRHWANEKLKDYLLKRNTVNNRLDRLEVKVFKLEEKTTEMENVIKGQLPPHEGIFYDGQIFDAFVFATGLIKQAKNEIVLIDNYIDETVLTMLDNRNSNVSATIYTANFNTKLQLALAKHNSQYQPIIIKVLNKFHDRFLIIDDDVYWIGASLKDLGKRVFAFSKMGIGKEMILNTQKDSVIKGFLDSASLRSK